MTCARCGHENRSDSCYRGVCSAEPVAPLTVLRPEREQLELGDDPVVANVGGREGAASVEGCCRDECVHDPQAVGGSMRFEQIGCPAADGLVRIHHLLDVLGDEALHLARLGHAATSLHQLHDGQGGDCALGQGDGRQEAPSTVGTAEVPDQDVGIEDYRRYRGFRRWSSHFSTLRMSRRPRHMPNPTGSSPAPWTLFTGASTATDFPRYVMTTSRPRRTSLSRAAVLCRRSLAVAVLNLAPLPGVCTEECTPSSRHR